MSNKECYQLLSLYVREVFLTSQILQAARVSARFENVGNPVQNVHYTEAMIREAAARGHAVQSATRTASEVMSMLETIVVKEDSERVKASEGIVMTKPMKIEYKDEWCAYQQGHALICWIRNAHVRGRSTHILWWHSIFNELFKACSAIPSRCLPGGCSALQFRKIHLIFMLWNYSHCNTAPVAFAILFGNEDKVGWDAFLKFTLIHHVGLNHYSKTYITDQAKSLVESVKGIMNEAGHFHCLYHRRKNILTYCKGGTKTYSAA